MRNLELLAQEQANLYVALQPEKNVEHESTIKNGNISGSPQLMGVGHIGSYIDLQEIKFMLS